MRAYFLCPALLLLALSILPLANFISLGCVSNALLRSHPFTHAHMNYVTQVTPITLKIWKQLSDVCTNKSKTVNRTCFLFFYYAEKSVLRKSQSNWSWIPGVGRFKGLEGRTKACTAKNRGSSSHTSWSSSIRESRVSNCLTLCRILMLSIFHPSTRPSFFFFLSLYIQTNLREIDFKSNLHDHHTCILDLLV